MFAKVPIRFRRILMVFRERKRSSIVPFSSVIDEMNTLMTKIGVTVTVTFVLTMGFVHSSLNKAGIVEYILNSPVQKIGMLLSAFNFVANPFVYVLLMPAFRDSLRKTFRLPSLRCGIVSKCFVTEGSHIVRTSSDNAPGGTELATSDIDVRETPSSLSVSTNNLLLQITPVMNTM